MKKNRLNKRGLYMKEEGVECKKNGLNKRRRNWMYGIWIMNIKNGMNKVEIDSMKGERIKWKGKGLHEKWKD